MAPFYEIEPSGIHRLTRGEKLEIRHPGPDQRTVVKILSDDQALVVTRPGRGIHIGKTNSKGDFTRTDVVSGEFLLNKESVFSSPRGTRGVIWRKR